MRSSQGIDEDGVNDSISIVSITKGGNYGAFMRVKKELNSQATNKTLNMSDRSPGDYVNQSNQMTINIHEGHDIANESGSQCQISEEENFQTEKNVIVRGGIHHHSQEEAVSVPMNNNSSTENNI